MTDNNILTQLESEIPKIVEAMCIRDITRVDGRLDEKVKLKYFDINCFPGLSFTGVICDMVVIGFYFTQIILKHMSIQY